VEGKEPEFEFELDIQEIPEGTEVYIIDDGELYATWYSGVCMLCEHYTPGRSRDEDWRVRLKARMRCKSFDVIPADIWEGRNRHTERYPGDKGFRFTRNVPQTPQTTKDDETG